MKIFKKGYVPPPSQYRSGDVVGMLGDEFEVIAANHTHVQLKGLRFAVPNWRVTLVTRVEGTGTS